MRRRAFRRSASLLVQNDLFLCIVFKDRRCLSLSSTAVLATTLMIIANPYPFVNPFFASFRVFNLTHVFRRFFPFISELSHLFQVK